MNIQKIKYLFKERWKFYLIGYIIGYIVPLIMEGIPNLRYLFPIRIMGIAGALLIGTAYYYGSRKTPVFEIVVRSIKYAVLIVLLILIAYGIKELVVVVTGIDITPYIGIPSPAK